MLLNRERAGEIMARENLDGLIAQLPVNSYYFSDYWGLFNTPGGYDGSYFAVLPRDATAPAALIVPALEVRRLETRRAGGRGTWIDNIFAYTSPLDELADSQSGIERFDDGTPRGMNYTGWPSAADAEFNELEQRWQSIVQQLGEQMSAGSVWAVVRALKAAGLEKRTLGTDDPRVAGLLKECGIDNAGIRYTPQLFNEIRLIKTDDEIALMRTAARINEHALLTAVDAMHEGAIWDELEDVYMMQMAHQGGRGVYLMCGVGELPAGYVRIGEPVFFDALGQYRHYHGDFGRCAVVGEPNAKHVEYHGSLLTGWEFAQEYLKPGIAYSELSAAVGGAVRNSGLSSFRDPVVHSVGLEHTDDPKPYGVQPQTKPDQVLQPNMIVNVDMPHSEIGWGSVHMEDTVLITNNGFERLSTADFSLRVV